MTLSPPPPTGTRRGLVRITLGLALLLHGLGNAVLQLRGASGAAPWPVVWTALCVVAIAGFVSAGLGVLGVRPLHRPLVPLAVTGAAAAVVGVFALGIGDLWPGLALSVFLPTAAWLWQRQYSWHPPGWTGRIGTGVGFALLGWVVASAVLWPWHRTWGATSAEWSVALPGDRVPRLRAHEILHAVTIEAPASAVWPWLVQLGQDRAGFYSYERLERLFGADVHNVREIRPEWQQRQPGDVVYATQAGYLRGLFGERPGWTVDLADPNRALVLRNWGAFVLEPAPDNRTRFLIRSTISHPDIPVWAAALNFAAFELPHFIMQRRMMLGIKELAEQRPAVRSAR